MLVCIPVAEFVRVTGARKDDNRDDPEAPILAVSYFLECTDSAKP